MNQTMQTDCDSTQRKLVLQALDSHKENIWSFLMTTYQMPLLHFYKYQLDSHNN